MSEGCVFDTGDPQIDRIERTNGTDPNVGGLYGPPSVERTSWGLCHLL